MKMKFFESKEEKKIREKADFMNLQRREASKLPDDVKKELIKELVDHAVKELVDHAVKEFLGKMDDIDFIFNSCTELTIESVNERTGKTCFIKIKRKEEANGTTSINSSSEEGSKESHQESCKKDCYEKEASKES